MRLNPLTLHLLVAVHEQTRRGAQREQAAGAARCLPAVERRVVERAHGGRVAAELVVDAGLGGCVVRLDRGKGRRDRLGGHPQVLKELLEGVGAEEGLGVHLAAHGVTLDAAAHGVVNREDRGARLCGVLDCAGELSEQHALVPGGCGERVRAPDLHGGLCGGAVLGLHGLYPRRHGVDGGPGRPGPLGLDGDLR